MLTKEEVLNALTDMPSVFTLAEIVDTLLFLDKINVGMEQPGNGETFSTEDAKKLLLDSFPDCSMPLNKSVPECKWELFTIALRFVVFKVTPNLKRIYLDINIEARRAKLIAYYHIPPSDLELELLDDIETNSIAHSPELYFTSETALYENHVEGEKHDFTVFAVFEAYENE